MDINTVFQIWALVQQHAWLALAVLIMGFITRLFTDDTKIPINIPPRWLPVVVLALGQVYSVLQMIAGGMAWKDAVKQGLLASFLTMGLFDLVIKAILNGADMPPWLAWLLKPQSAAAIRISNSKRPPPNPGA